MGSHMHPRKVYQVLFPFKRYFRCAQAQHFLVFCWLVVALIRDPGKSTLKGLGRICLPSSNTGRPCGWFGRGNGTPKRRRRRWPRPRSVRSRHRWTACCILSVIASLSKAGQQHPLGHTTRHSEHDPYTFGFEMVLLMALGPLSSRWPWCRSIPSVEGIRTSCSGRW